MIRFGIPILIATYRLEKYSWRARESFFNSNLPQFRTIIAPPYSNTPLRIHFIHIYSMHTHAVPLLLIPPFPLTNLSLMSLYEPLTDPNADQPFHVIVPTIPGLGFSDAFASCDHSLLSSTASVFNTLMLRLGYEHYIVSGAGSGIDSLAGLDYHLPRLISDLFPENCLGVHLINPPLAAPALITSPLRWAKFTISRMFQTSIFGYAKEDLKALKEAAPKSWVTFGSRLIRKGISSVFSTVKRLPGGTVGVVGLGKSNALAYALCDSPVGMLGIVCNSMKKTSPELDLSNSDIIDLTHLAWLPGPEAGMRFLSAAIEEVEDLAQDIVMEKRRSRVGVTLFHDDNDDDRKEWNDREDCSVYGYACPAWAEGDHDVVFTQRLSGRAGLVALERPDAVAEGIRGLARELSKKDRRLTTHNVDEVFTDDEKVNEQTENLGGGAAQKLKEETDEIGPEMRISVGMDGSDLDWEKVEMDGEIEVMRNVFTFDTRWLLCWVVIFSIWRPKLRTW